MSDTLTHTPWCAEHSSAADAGEEICSTKAIHVPTTRPGGTASVYLTQEAGGEPLIGVDVLPGDVMSLASAELLAAHLRELVELAGQA